MNIIGNEHIDMFQQIIDSEVEAKVKTILDDANDEGTQLRTDSERLELADAYNDMAKTKKEITASTLSEIAGKKQLNRKAFLLHREKLIDGIFDRIADRLRSYSETDEYRSRLMRSFEKFRDDSSAVVGVRAADFDYLSSQRHECGLEKSPSIIFGGLTVIYPQRGIMNDLSFDSAFKSRRIAFGVEYAELLRNGND